MRPRDVALMMVPQKYHTGSGAVAEIVKGKNYLPKHVQVIHVGFR